MTDFTPLWAAAEQATKGEWQVYDSCSWRRIGLKDKFETILQPCNDSDGHPNMCGPNAINDLHYIALANPATILHLLARLEAAERVVEIGRRVHNLNELHGAIAAYDTATKETP